MSRFIFYWVGGWVGGIPTKNFRYEAHKYSAIVTHGATLEEQWPKEAQIKIGAKIYLSFESCLQKTRE